MDLEEWYRKAFGRFALAVWVGPPRQEGCEWWTSRKTGWDREMNAWMQANA
jgi:hypothetical protein